MSKSALLSLLGSSTLVSAAESLPVLNMDQSVEGDEMVGQLRSVQRTNM